MTTNKDTHAKKDEPAKDAPLTADVVQRMIDAALAKHDLVHGHLSQDDHDALTKET